MTTLELLQSKNSHLSILPVHHKAFARYGRVILSFDTNSLRQAAQDMEMPAQGVRYLPALHCLDQHPDASLLRQTHWGQLDAQIGLCWGYSNTLNALEWHTSSEINIGVTDLVLLLADQREIDGSRLDSKKVEAFYLAQGEMIELYATTLHFCPCAVTSQGFSCIVVLPRGTNEPLEQGVEASPLLWAKNKWLIAHEGNDPLLRRGATAGIYGENWALAPITKKEK